MRVRPALIIEFLLLCVAFPGFIIIGRHAPYMFAFLWAATGYCWFILRFRYNEHLRSIWNGRAVTWAHMKPILLRWLLATVAMYFFLRWYDAGRLFYIWEHNPSLIPKLLVFYPLLSALPQEFIFCSFFFERYKPLFGTGAKMIAASAITFAYAHILYINPVAPVLSLLGGIIFAQTYARHRSLALVTIEHGLYGASLFLVGLGWYFYSGAVPVTP